MRRSSQPRASASRLGTRGQPEESRAAILQAAAREFAEQGIAGARTDAIAVEGFEPALDRAEGRIRIFGREATRDFTYVYDVTTGKTLFALRERVPRSPASVEKLYTTSTALLRYGADATLTSTLLGSGTQQPGGVLQGDLYLRGAGDPTFGSAAFVHRSYGEGATVEALAKSNALPRFTVHTLTDPEALGHELERVRQRGYSFDREEGEIGLCCVGVPIFDHRGQVRYALSLSAPAGRLSLDLAHELGLARRLRAKEEPGQEPAEGEAARDDQ